MDITANRHKGADTSVEAFQSTPCQARQRMRDTILELIRSKPVTTEEVSLALAIPYTAASARMSELKRDGLIVDTGERRPTATGRPARVMAAR